MAGSETLRRPAPIPVPPDYPRTPRSGADFIYGALLLVLLTVAAVGVASMAGVFEDDAGGTNPPVEEPAAPAGEGRADEGPDVRYREELRANWDVVGVAADDVLNVRAGPGVSAEIVATLAPETAELESTGRIADVGTALWREVVVPGDGVGWVNAAFLTETAP